MSERNRRGDHTPEGGRFFAPTPDSIARRCGTPSVAPTRIDLLPAAPAGGQREGVRKLFEVVVEKAGPETLSMLDVFLSRLAESPSSAR